jgi:hypothetical protein
VLVLLPVVAVSDFNDDGASPAVSPFGFVEFDTRIASIVTLRDRFAFAGLDRFHAAAVLRRNSLLGETLDRVGNAGSQRIVVPRGGVIRLRVISARVASSPQDRLGLFPQTRRGFVDVSVVLVLVVVFLRGAVDHSVLVLVQRLEQFRRPILETLHEHSLIITGVVTGAVSYKTVRVYTVLVEIFLASAKAGNQSRTFEADGILFQSVQVGVARVHPWSSVVVGVDVQALAPRQVRFVSPCRFRRPQLPRDGVDDRDVDGAVRFVVLFEPGRRLVAGHVPGEGLRVALVGRRTVHQTTRGFTEAAEGTL